MNSDQKTTARLLAVLCLSLLFSGCGGYAFSPESAVLSEIARGPMHEFTVEAGSAQILQNVPLGMHHIVLVGFRGSSPNSGKQVCLFEYRVVRRLGGWMTSNGGGSCQNDVFEPQEVISIGSSMSSGDGVTDPGASTVSGWVLNDKVDTVRVFWSDGEEQSASIENKSYVAARVGKIQYSRIEAWDSSGNLLLTVEQPAAAPGKE